MPKRTQSYDAWQMDKLTLPGAAASFLNAARADSNEMFLVALRKVAQAHQMAWVAKQANVQRETLYRALSESGNPTHLTLSAILDALELDFQVIPKKKPRSFDEGSRDSAPKQQAAVATEASQESSVVDIEAFRYLQVLVSPKIAASVKEASPASNLGHEVTNVPGTSGGYISVFLDGERKVS